MGSPEEHILDLWGCDGWDTKYRGMVLEVVVEGKLDSSRMWSSRRCMD